MAEFSQYDKELQNFVSGGKSEISSSIINKGGAVTNELFSSLISGINNLQTLSGTPNQVFKPSKQIEMHPSKYYVQKVSLYNIEKLPQIAVYYIQATGNAINSSGSSSGLGTNGAGLVLCKIGNVAYWACMATLRQTVKMPNYGSATVSYSSADKTLSFTINDAGNGIIGNLQNPSADILWYI